MIALHCVRQLGVLTCLLSLIGCSNGRASLEDAEAAAAQETFTVGGGVSGLTGSGLILQNNGGSDLAVSANGSFTFAASSPNGTSYNVTVLSQPSNPGQICTVANGSGSIAGGNVTNIAVTCATATFAVGGAVTGLLGSGLVLQNNGGDDLAIAADGSFSFAAPLAAGAAYTVTVRTQPGTPSQTCAIANATGSVGDVDVTDVAVTCTTSVFTIGGTVTGLKGSGLVLQKNRRDDLAIASNGSFTFETEQASGTSYEVTVRTQPVEPTQTCTVADGSATVGGGNVRNVRVTCATDSFAIGGTVSGLLGSELILRNNGGDDIGVDSSGGFTFPTEVASGAAYNVTVRTQPANPTQACMVTSSTGTVGGADITNIAVNCTTSEFMIGGSVSGLEGSGLALRNNGADERPINADGDFTFATALQSGATYNVTIATQPTSPTQTCTLLNASGTVGNTHVTNVAISCVTTEFTVGGTVSGLFGSGLVLQNNGSDDFAIAANGVFTFPASLPSGTPYEVRVETHPINQVCVVENELGTVGSVNVTDVAVNCVTIGF